MSRRMRDRYMRDRRKRRMDYEYAHPEYDSRYDSARGRDRYYPEEYYMDDKRYSERDRSYRRDYHESDYEKEYEDDLKDWTTKLKRFDRFGLSKEQVIQQAKDMGVKFKDFTEDEFYTIYLMHISDYPTIANEYHTYLNMAKSWLEDDDIKLDPSDKVCKYLYEIVLADED